MVKGRLLAAEITDWGSVFFIASLAAIRGLPAPANPPIGILPSLHAAILVAYFPLVLASALAQLVSKVLQRVLKSESKLRLKAVLDVLLDSSFAITPGAERHHNRVTLFRPHGVSKKLRVFCRSGTQYQRCSSQFAIDDEHEDANQGVAGRAWFKDATVYAELPEALKPWNSANASCINYAKAGYLEADHAKQLEVKSRSIWATPVRDKAGARWGVLVLDSRRPKGVENAATQEHALLVAAAIGRMI